MRIELPFPHKLLWPNGGRGHPRAVAGQTKKHKEWARLATLEALDGSTGFIPSQINLIVYAKPKGPLPDKDNCIAAYKSLQDGIALGLRVDDQNFPAPTVSFADERDGRFVVEVLP